MHPIGTRHLVRAIRPVIEMKMLTMTLACCLSAFLLSGSAGAIDPKDMKIESLNVDAETQCAHGNDVDCCDYSGAYATCCYVEPSGYTWCDHWQWTCWKDGDRTNCGWKYMGRTEPCGCDTACDNARRDLKLA